MELLDSLYPFREFAIWYNRGTIHPLCYLAWLSCSTLARLINSHDPADLVFEPWPLWPESSNQRIPLSIRSHCKHTLLNRSRSVKELDWMDEIAYDGIARRVLESASHQVHRETLLLRELMPLIFRHDSVVQALASSGMNPDSLSEKLWRFDDHVVANKLMWSQYHRPDIERCPQDSFDFIWIAGRYRVTRSMVQSIRGCMRAFSRPFCSSFLDDIEEKLPAGPIRLYAEQKKLRRIGHVLDTEGYSVYPGFVHKNLISYTWKRFMVRLASDSIGSVAACLQWRDEIAKETADRSLLPLKPGVNHGIETSIELEDIYLYHVSISNHERSADVLLKE